MDNCKCKIVVELKKSESEVNIEDKKINVEFKEQEDVNIEVKEQPQTLNIMFRDNEDVDFNVEDRISIVSRTDKHRNLTGLSYEESGHTGFASALDIMHTQEEIETLRQNTENTLSIIINDINNIKDNYVPKRMENIPNVSPYDNRANMSLFVDNNGTDGKITLRNALDSKIRTCNSTPDDWQVGDYIFLKS